jgi:uncharacterized protein YcnI
VAVISTAAGWESTIDSGKIMGKWENHGKSLETP